MDLTFVIMLVIMGLVFFGLNSFTKRSNQKRTAERDRMLQDEMVPGAWVHTTVGFYGRFVDLDGDVLILETPGGVETYWNKAVVRTVGDLPFEVEEEVLQLDAPDGVEGDLSQDSPDYAQTPDQSDLDDDSNHKE